MSSRMLVGRSDEREILDSAVPDETAAQAYRQLALLHALLGDTGALLSALRRDRRPLRKVLEIGCARGDVLHTVSRRLGLEAVGVDARRLRNSAPVQIIQADAVCDPLPEADVAFSMHTAHHLNESELIQLIRNVGRFCRRFILIDIVRDPLPMSLFRMLVAPFAAPVVAADGLCSFRRAYTPGELRSIAEAALENTGATFTQSVASLRIRQTLDIDYV